MTIMLVYELVCLVIIFAFIFLDLKKPKSARWRRFGMAAILMVVTQVNLLLIGAVIIKWVVDFSPAMIWGVIVVAVISMVVAILGTRQMRKPVPAA